MFKRPEELIMAVLLAVWVAFTYFAADRLGAPFQTALLIAALNLVCAFVLFLLWLRGKHTMVWPLFLGLAAACWFPLLDWFALGSLEINGTLAETLAADNPAAQTWFASPPFKAAIALLPVAAGYAFKFKQYRKRKQAV